MSELTPFEFTSKECRCGSHYDCAGYWRGIGIEAICICKCGHKENQKVLESVVEIPSSNIPNYSSHQDPPSPKKEVE